MHRVRSRFTCFTPQCYQEAAKCIICPKGYSEDKNNKKHQKLRVRKRRGGPDRNLTIRPKVFVGHTFNVFRRNALYCRFIVCESASCLELIAACNIVRSNGAV